MPMCGNCHNPHVSARDIKACYQLKTPPSSFIIQTHDRGYGSQFHRFDEVRRAIHVFDGFGKNDKEAPKNLYMMHGVTPLTASEAHTMTCDKGNKENPCHGVPVGYVRPDSGRGAWIRMCLGHIRLTIRSREEHASS